MKVLFVGKYNPYTVALAARLAKNNVGVAVVNDEPSKAALGVRHTQYRVGTGYISRIYDNYRPDMVIVTSAHDGGDYLDGLENVLRQGVASGLKRLIFLSSTSVYGVSDPGHLPPETDPVKPASWRGVQFAAGEDLCRRWEETSQLKVTVLRLSMCYGPNAPTADINALVGRLQNGERLSLSRKAMYSAIHLEDVSEAVMQLLEAAFSPTYNISSRRQLKPQALANALEEAAGQPESVELTGDSTDCRAADSSLFRSEYNWGERHSLEELPRIAEAQAEAAAQVAKKKARREKREEARVTGGINWLGYVETVLLFVVAVLLTLVQENTPLIGEVDFLVLYLVLVAITMNLQQAAVGLLLSCGMLVYQQMTLGYDIFSAVLNYNTLMKAAEYCIVGIAVSYMIQRLKTRLQFARLEKSDLENEIKVIEQFSDDNLNSRHFFEDQILEYEVSLPRITAMTARLDVLEPERILPETVNILSDTIVVEDVAAYVIGRKGGRMRLSYARTQRAAAMGQSPVMDDFDELLRVLNADQVYINRGQDSRYPALASGVQVDGELAMVFVLWDIPFAKMRLDTMNLLQSITRLVSAALRRAYQYEELTRAERYVGDTGILNAEAFRRVCEARSGEDGAISGILCRVQTDRGAIGQMSRKLEPLVRENDYLGLDESGDVLVLLSGTNAEGFGVFRKRLGEKGISCALLGGNA